MACEHLFCWYPNCLERDKCPRLGEFPTHAVVFKPYRPRHDLPEIEPPGGPRPGPVQRWRDLQ